MPDTQWEVAVWCWGRGDALACLELCVQLLRGGHLGIFEPPGGFRYLNLPSMAGRGLEGVVLSVPGRGIGGYHWHGPALARVLLNAHLSEQAILH